MHCNFFSLFQARRLPFLPSSNLALETLEGRDEFIDFDDYIFNGKYLNRYLILISLLYL